MASGARTTAPPTNGDVGPAPTHASPTLVAGLLRDNRTGDPRGAGDGAAVCPGHPALVLKRTDQSRVIPSQIVPVEERVVDGRQLNTEA
eukprot:scaffold256432_cov30-Tisochrysis_lutea.AAC.3